MSAPRSARFRIFPKLCAVIFASAALFLVACDSQYLKKKDVEEQLDKISKTIDSSWQQTDVAIEEVKKLQQYEYEILRLPVREAEKSLKTRLNELGKERWDCFHAQKAAAESESSLEELLIICKRRPETPLKYIPRNLFGAF